ncbi:MAG: DUF1819 family protein [Fibrobacteres bacterium]|nr:DUF1819 family protein [Fibrobacterota bacterium]
MRPDAARVIAESYLTTKDWEATKQLVLANNSLQVKSRACSIRIERELRVRLQTLTHHQIELLANGSMDTRVAIAWLSVTKHTPFLFQLASDVLRHKMEVHDPLFRPSDYENYITALTEIHPTLSSISPLTKNKVRSMVNTILREVGILNNNLKAPEIQRPSLPVNVFESIVLDNKKWLAGFLFSNAEIQELKAA